MSNKEDEMHQAIRVWSECPPEKRPTAEALGQRIAEIARGDGRPWASPAVSDARPIDEWGEDMGDMLWWKFPIEEAPYVGTPLDCGYTVETEVVVRSRTHMDPHGKQRTLRFNRDVGGWPGYHTHFTPIKTPLTPRSEMEQ